MNASAAPAPGIQSPAVSVVLPTHNRGIELQRAVDSVLAQTYCDFELIIVDDASSDCTPQVLERYIDQDDRVQVIRLEENRGGGGARNRGIEESVGRWIAFQDSDDYWFPTKLQVQVDALSGDPNSRFCYCGSLYYGEQRSYYLPSPRRFTHFGGDMAEEVLKGSPASTQTILIERELLDSAGLFDPAFKRLQDWDLVIRFAQATPFTFVEEPLVMINYTPISISSVPINDAIFRAEILSKYSDLFALAPQAAAAHHFIAARLFHKNGHKRRALRHYTASFNLRARNALSQPLSHPSPTKRRSSLSQ